METKYKWIIVLLGVLLAFNSCNDDAIRVFKQHLLAQITATEQMFSSVIFGTEEGEYKEGGAEFLSEEINHAKNVFWNPGASQQEVDDCCSNLLKAEADFSNWMNPYKSVMNALIETCLEKLFSVPVGDGDGMIPEQSDKDLLQAAVDEAKAFMQNNLDMTQRELDKMYNELLSKLFEFEDKIPGTRKVTIENHSFELPGNEEIYPNFEEIPGWNSVGPIKGIDSNSPYFSPALVGRAGNKAWWLKDREIPDGKYVLHTMCYYDRIWQTLQEFVHSHSRYTLSFDYTRGSQWIDPDMRLRVELIAFNGKIGDFSDIVILNELELLRVEEQADFKRESLILDVPYKAEYIGKQMAICFRSYYQRPWVSTEDESFYWPKQKTGVEVDNVTLTCEKLEEKK